MLTSWPKRKDIWRMVCTPQNADRISSGEN
jgi:hypothetical protein